MLKISKTSILLYYVVKIWCWKNYSRVIFYRRQKKCGILLLLINRRIDEMTWSKTLLRLWNLQKWSQIQDIGMLWNKDRLRTLMVQSIGAYARLYVWDRRKRPAPPFKLYLILYWEIDTLGFYYKRDLKKTWNLWLLNNKCYVLSEEYGYFSWRTDKTILFKKSVNLFLRLYLCIKVPFSKFPRFLGYLIFYFLFFLF